MDAHLQGNPQLYRVKGGATRGSRPGEDVALQSLSQEEQECLQFFEKTIDSLEESLEENDRRKPPASSSRPVRTTERPPTMHPIVSSLLARHPSPKDQDIIYLVRPEPDLVQTKESNFSPTNPDFQSMMQNPESHFEMKPRRDSLPSEYNPPLPSGSYGPSDSPSSYHPPGCIPTPVLIAQQIAENQAGGNFNPSPFLRSSSHESDKSQSPTGDLVKHGPPTSAKPTRFPANISMYLSNKEHQNQPLANVSIQERRAQMLSNLTGTSNSLLQEDLQPAVDPRARNIPTRSISFKDPSPEKSRMEALSKLGLNRSRAMSGEVSLLSIPTSTHTQTSTKPVEASASPTAKTSASPLDASASPTAKTSASPLDASASPTTKTDTLPEVNVTTQHQIQTHVDGKPEVLQTDSLKRYEERSHQPSPSPPAVTESSDYPAPLEDNASFPPPPEVTSLELNRYGGKSIIVNPSISSKSESIAPVSHEPKVLPTALTNRSEFNSYGGKTKVVSTAGVTRSQLPDILSSHIDKGQTSPTKSELLPTELNNYGGKSRTFNPSTGLNHPTVTPTRSSKAPAPTPAPRPPRHSYHGVTQKPAVPPEHRHRSSMFRPQGITVQFSGKGATDESRREALRKLGLLKDS